MIIYFVYAIILSVHRRSVIAPVPNVDSSGVYKMDNNNNNEVVNPDNGNDYGNDEAEL